MKKTKLAVTFTTSALLASQLAAQNPDAIRPQLAQIEPAKAEDPAMGAMCYEIAFEPERMEYTCPTCGERSFHAAADGLIDEKELVSCRRLVRELPLGERFTLDESAFCRKCRPDAAVPELILQVRNKDGKIESVHGIDAGALTLLAEVLRGQKQADSAEIRQSVLKTLTRLDELVAMAGKNDDTRRSQP